MTSTHYVVVIMGALNHRTDRCYSFWFLHVNLMSNISSLQKGAEYSCFTFCLLHIEKFKFVFSQ